MLNIIPFGDRLLVRRKKVGEKVGSIYLPENTSERPTDLAEVIAVSELTFGDQEIIKNADKILERLIDKAKDGDSDAVIHALRLTEFIKMKSIKVGDSVMVGKYTGVDFFEKESNKELTLVREQDIIGLVVDNG